jgi:hypothetical protein
MSITAKYEETPAPSIDEFVYALKQLFGKSRVVAPWLEQAVGQLLPGKIIQEEMLLRTLFKPVWDSSPKKTNLSHVYHSWVAYH